MTHYIGFFTTSRWPRSVCGLSSRFVTFEHSPEPTCPKCAAWLLADPKEAAALSAQWAAMPYPNQD